MIISEYAWYGLPHSLKGSSRKLVSAISVSKVKKGTVESTPDIHLDMFWILAELEKEIVVLDQAALGMVGSSFLGPEENGF